jgi:uncharacterized protein GlcG (DUF336 family)
MNISLSDATAIVDGAISRADAMGVPVNMAVVDGGRVRVVSGRRPSDPYCKIVSQVSPKRDHRVPAKK